MHQVAAIAQVIAQCGEDAVDELGDADVAAQDVAGPHEAFKVVQQLLEFGVVATEPVAGHDGPQQVEDGHVEEALEVDDAARVALGQLTDLGHRFHNLAIVFMQRTLQFSQPKSALPLFKAIST